MATYQRLRTTCRRPCVSLAGWDRQARRCQANVRLRCPNKENRYELSAFCQKERDHNRNRSHSRPHRIQHRTSYVLHLITPC